MESDYAARSNRSGRHSEIHFRQEPHQAVLAADRECGKETRTTGLGVRHAVALLARGRWIRSPAARLEVRRAPGPKSDCKRRTDPRVRVARHRRELARAGFH